MNTKHEPRTVLVAGGAGYIGAHVVRLLLERGDKVVVVDDLSYGTPERIGQAKLVQLDVAGAQAQERLEQVNAPRRRRLRNPLRCAQAGR